MEIIGENKVKYIKEKKKKENKKKIQRHGLDKRFYLIFINKKISLKSI